MRFESRDLREGVIEISVEADGAVVDEDVRRRLLARDGVYGVVQPVLAQPPPHADRMSCREDDDVEAAGAQRFEKSSRARPRWIPMVRVLPARVAVQHTVEIDADDGANRVSEIDAPHTHPHAHPHAPAMLLNGAPGNALIFVRRSIMANDERQSAQRRLTDLIAIVRTLPSDAHLTNLMEEAEALNRAIAAFHLEGIRFRMYNVDRLASRSPVPLPPEAQSAVDDLHRHLEAAGFHTRSHQAPT